MVKESKVIDKLESQAYLSSQLAKLVPVEIACPLEGLTSGDQKALKKLVAAAAVMDEIFLKQVYVKNVALKKSLQQFQEPGAKDALEYFNINFGPFDRINNHHPFIGQIKKPDGANYYPENMTKDEFLAHLKANPDDENVFTSNYTLIKRECGKLTAVPYNVAYAEELEKAAQLMSDAAALTENASLKKYLLSRAEAFKSNNYRQSDMDWMDLTDHDLEVVIGPYEVYEDTFWGYKAAFEGFITRVDREESAKLKKITTYMDELELNLPIDDQYKNFSRGKSSPIVVTDEIYTGGDTKAGVQTTAFNLPNDEYVREIKGSKKVMLKNIARAKYDSCWVPIVQAVLSEGDLENVSFDAYFNHVLLHEIAHGLGPGTIKVDGRETTVNKELKELYSTIEEAKADILGLWNLVYLVKKGEFPEELEDKLFSTYLGGIFRSVRFGIGEAHGGANAIQLNYILEKGGFAFDEQAVRYSVIGDKMMEAVKALSHELLMIQATGDYEKAKIFITTYRKIDDNLQKALDKVKDVPIDIHPRFEAERFIKTTE
ncbi:MAG: peptidase [Candidatus Aegiribacteria sp.]|nr:peptidase [Candidatus Aegiribacteria sp.]